MADCSKNKNPLIRSGTNRSQRFLDALDTKFVVPDEKKMENWLVYARDLAAHIKYYNSANKSPNNEDWQPFFDSDISAQLALISVQDVNDFKDMIRSLLSDLQSEDYKNHPSELRQRFGLLFSGLLSLTYRINYFWKILPDESVLKKTISDLIITRLSAVLKRLLAYYKSAVDAYQQSLVEDKTVADWTILAYKQEKLSEVIGLIKKDLTDKWIYKTGSSAPLNFEDYYTNYIQEDKTIYNHFVYAVSDSQLWGILNHAANHNLFTSIFGEYLVVYSKIVNDAKQQLLKTVSGQNTHEPHYALYLAFLHIFEIAQTEINSYTRRHLDYYYKEVLQLTQKKSQPNHVHLILEPAKTVSEYLVKKGTAFDAGKDSTKKEVIYTSDEDIILNHASVEELRSFYRATSVDVIGSASQEGLLYASPYAASSDGAGGKLTSESKDWHPFANKTYTEGALSAVNMPAASIGFAFASHYLSLKEGDRKITIKLHGQSLNKLSGKTFYCYLTGKKKWEGKTDFTITANSSSLATIVIHVKPSDPPVTDYNEKIHLSNLKNTDTPVVKFILKNTAGKNQYDDLKDVKISSVDIKVAVGNKNEHDTSGIKELMISSDSGTVDPSKPFFPFGQNPKKGAGLVIGNEEVFSKKGAKITLSILWADLDLTIQDMDYNVNDIFFPTAQLKFLENGVWVNESFKSILNSERLKKGPAKNAEVELFWGKNSVMIPDVYLPSSQAAIPEDSIVDYKDEYTPYGIKSQGGFLKLELNADFQFDKYFSDLQIYLIELANKTPAASKTVKTLPVKPYNPKIQSIYLSYEAETTIQFSSKVSSSDRLIHIYPFGNDPVESKNIENSSAKLMPQFTHSENGSGVHHIAEFYVGLKNVVPEQKVSVLFKMLEGSTNPLQSKPSSHVFWSFLGNNKWIDFDKNDITDNTRELIETGTISFPFSDKATNTNTLLPSGYYWLKAGIKEMPEQVCRLVSVKAQAVKATFKNQSNAEDFLKQPLAAGTIKKLKYPDASVSKVEQPYASYGGRYKEDAKNFYTRISERLRHKNRAVTIRDFEQLVLEGFPDIHKVKCLNHTRLELKETKTVYNEQAAGHVTVITIPDLQLKNAINPLRPYTSRNTLEEIKDFLEVRTNCNMTLHVENPVFEEIRIVTTVALTSAAAGNNSYYTGLLKQDLVKFLTPWAYDTNTDINFGGKISKSVLLDFIEERNYIDYILELKMFHNKMDGTSESDDMEEIWASKALSVLVSAPASKHTVTIKD